MYSLSWAACWVRRLWTQQNDCRPSQRNAEGNRPFSKIIVLPALIITKPAIFRGKKKEHLSAMQITISHPPETKTEERHYQLFHVLDIYIKHSLLCLVNIIKHNLFRRIFICSRLGNHTAQFDLGEPGPSQRKSLACSFIKVKKAIPFQRALQTGAVDPYAQASSFIENWVKMGVEKKEVVLQWSLLLQSSVVQEFSAAPVSATSSKIPRNTYLHTLKYPQTSHSLSQTPLRPQTLPGRLQINTQ